MNFLGYLSDGQVVFKSCFEHCPTCEGRLICPEEHVSSLNKCNPIWSQVSGLKSQVFRGYLGFCQSHVPGSPGKSQVIVPSCSSPGKSLDIPGHGMFQYHPRFSQAPGITWDNLGLFQSQIVPGNPRLSQVFLKSREIPGYPRSWHVPIPSQVPGQPGTWEKLGFWPGTVQGYPRISREVYLAGVTPLLTHWNYVSFALGSIVMMYFFRRCHSGSCDQRNTRGAQILDIVLGSITGFLLMHLLLLLVVWVREVLLGCLLNPFVPGPMYFMEPTTVGSLWLENDLHENELEFESHMGRLKKFVRVISDEIHGNPRDLNMYRTGRSVALSRGRKSIPPIWVSMRREAMKLGVYQREFMLKHSDMNESRLSLWLYADRHFHLP